MSADWACSTEIIAPALAGTYEIAGGGVSSVRHIDLPRAAMDIAAEASVVICVAMASLYYYCLMNAGEFSLD